MEAGAIKVLIADDHSLLRQGLARLIEREERITVVGQAANGQEAVEMVGETFPNVVLMDISMPVCNGIEATWIIRRRWPSVQVLALTIHDDEGYISEMIRAGARGYVLKDAEPDNVFQAIYRIHDGETFFPPDLMEKVMERFHYLSSEQSPHSSVPSHQEPLTRRELDVLECIVKGLSNREIASALYISEKTVKNHITSLLRKLHVSDRTQAAVLAVQSGMIRGGG